MQKIGVSLVVGIILVWLTVSAGTVQAQSEGNIYLPVIIKQQIFAFVEVENLTGGTLCYTLQDTGLGEMCFGPGINDYGEIIGGAYTWQARIIGGNCDGKSGDGERFYTHGLVLRQTFTCEVTGGN